MDRDLSSARMTQPGGIGPGIFQIDSPGGAPYRAMITTVAGDSATQALWTLQVAVDLTQEQVVLGQQRIWIWTVLAAALVLCRLSSLPVEEARRLSLLAERKGENTSSRRDADVLLPVKLICHR